MCSDVGLFIAMGRAAVVGAFGPVAVGAACALAPARRLCGRWSSRRWRGVWFSAAHASPCAMWGAVHASVIVGVLPWPRRPATAAPPAPVARLLGLRTAGHGAGWRFALLRSGSTGLALHPADLLLLAAMLRRRRLWLWRPPVTNARRRRDLLALRCRCSPRGAAERHRPGTDPVPATARPPLAMWPCFRCGWLRLVQGAWRWAARCASARCNWCSPFRACCLPCPAGRAAGCRQRRLWP